MKNHVIIVAGGSGTRFGSTMPKQFLTLGQRPVLLHTLYAFADVAADITLVIPEAHFDTWRHLCQQYAPVPRHNVVAGGPTRFQSVKNGLDAIADTDPDAVVAIHDGVRPLVSKALIERTLQAAERVGGAIPVVPVTDSIRQMSASGSHVPVLRSSLRAVQTPQCFRLADLRRAYLLPFDPAITDDAMAYERLGRAVELVEGDSRNIKITGPNDLAIAQLLMNHDKLA